MKKIISFVLAALLVSAISVCVLPVSASASSDKTITLNVYNWGEYISDGSEGSVDVNAEFEKYYKDKYGVTLKVNYTTYDSNESMYAKLKTGSVNYDVVIPSDYMIQLMIEENMLEKLNFENIPNYQYIDTEYKNLYFDPTDEYSVPYTAGMVGIIYNSEFVEGTPDSWSLMWNEAYKGKILNFNNSRDAFGTSMYYLGIDVNTTNTADWDSAFEKLKEQKPILQAYVMDEIFNKMKNGSAYVAPYYAGDFLSMYADNESLRFYYPKEGTNIFVDSMCVPKGAANKAIAEEYINFMLSEEIAVANAEYICYASPNTLVRENEEYRACMQEMHADALEILYPENVGKVSYFENLPAETRDYMNKRWEDIKNFNTIAVALIVIIVVVAVVLIGGGIFLAVRKKMRSDY